MSSMPVIRAVMFDYDHVSCALFAFMIDLIAPSSMPVFSGLRLEGFM